MKVEKTTTSKSRYLTLSSSALAARDATNSDGVCWNAAVSVMFTSIF